MKSFKTFITETTAVDLSQVHALLATPIPNVNETRLGLARDALKKLEAALAAKTIWNADFTDIKSRLGGVLEYAYDAAKNQEFYAKMPDWENNGSDGTKRWAWLDQYDVDSQGGFQGAKKEVAHWSKHKDMFPGLLRVTQAQLAVKTALDVVKPFIQKGRAPKPVDPNKFVKPMVPYEAKKLAIGFLDKVIDDVRGEYTKSVYASFARDLEAAKAISPTTYKDFDKITNPTVKQIANRIWYRKGLKYELVDDAEATVKKIADDQIQMVFGEFLSKNAEKLGHIFAKKEAVKEHKILSNRVRAGSLENIMYFEFTDGSSFKITSTVEGAYSPRGVYFLRLPTRFSDVKLANGTKMSMPSEEKMIKEF